MRTDFKQLIMQGRAALEAQHEWPHDRSKYMNASEADSCIRRQWYAKNGYEGEDQDWGYARRGSHGEKYIVESLRAANVPLLLAGEDQDSLTDDEHRLAATPDGVLAWDDKDMEVSEFKTIDPRTNRLNLPRSAHVTQLQIAMWLLNQNVLKETPAVGGWLVYMDASNYNDIVQHWVPFDAKIADRLAPRAKKLLRARSADALDREGKRTGECNRCPFKGPCGVSLDPQPGRKRSNRGSRLDAMAQRFLELKDQENALKEEKDNLKEDIKSELHKRDVAQTVVGSVEIKLTMVKGRTTLDKKAVKAAGIDLSPFEKEGAPSERLDVKAVDAA
jgi:hypothetical protein